MPTHLTRRRVLVLLAAGAAVLTTRLSPAMAQQGGDTAFIRQLGGKLTAILNGSGSLADRRKQILPLIDEYVDVNGIARFSLGRYWSTATPEQQQHFLVLFHRVLLNSITSKMGDFRGVQVHVEGSAPHGAGSNAVNTIISRPGQPTLNVQWVVKQVDGAPKISDVIGEGVSLSITERGDYTSYLGRNGGSISALLKAMERQAAHQQA